MHTLVLLLLSAYSSLQQDGSENITDVSGAVPQQKPLYRIVVTLNAYNACEVGDQLLGSGALCAKVAKCYGRRLVLSVESCSLESMEQADAWVRTSLGDSIIIVTVEEDGFLSSAGSDRRQQFVVEGQMAPDKTAVYAQINDTMSVGDQVQGQLSSADNATAASSYQWNLQMLDIDNTWERLGTYGERSTVVVLDSGIASSTLPAYIDWRNGGASGSRILQGYDFVSDEALSNDGDGRDPDYFDPGDADSTFCPGQPNSWHGSKVTSVLGANYSGFLGVAPGTYILPVRVLGRCKTGYASDVADAIMWAAGGFIQGLNMSSFHDESDVNRNRVVIMAFAGLGPCPSYMQSAVDWAVLRNITLYSAAGNDPTRQAADYFPSNCNGVLAVGALNWQGQHASYSSKNADVYMPGGDYEKSIPCLGVDLNIDLRSCIGTSMAVPHAGGLEALQRQLVQDSTFMEGNGTVYSYVTGMSTYIAYSLNVSTGSAHSCAIIQGSSIICWGAGSSGQLGDGLSSGQALVPVFVQGINNANQVSLGTSFSCAVLATGSVMCWGLGTSGQLGYGTAASTTTPIAVSGITNAIQVDAGAVHTCAVLSTKSVKCWGAGMGGQLGNNAQVQQNSPVTVSGISTAVQVSCADQHSCAVLSSGGINCWGLGLTGQLGNGGNGNVKIPVVVSGISNAAQVSCGVGFTCAVLKTGLVKCWGLGTSGQLGNGATASTNTAVTVSAITNAVSVYAGDTSACALLSTGGIMCWGSGANGRLGNAGTAQQNTPVNVTGMPASATMISSDNSHACAILSTGSIVCWGGGGSGRLGNGLTADSSVPVDAIQTTACACGYTTVGCSACPAGTSSGGTNANYCLACPGGTYSNKNGSCSCTGCGAGSYSIAVGAVDSSPCIQCSLGTFALSTVNTICATCPDGLTNSNDRSSCNVACTVQLRTSDSLSASLLARQQLDSCIYQLMPGVHSGSSACELSFIASSSQVRVILQGMGTSPSDTIINCSAARYFASVGAGFNLTLRN